MSRRVRFPIAAALAALSVLRSAPAQSVDCDGFPFNLVVRTTPIMEPPHQTSELHLESEAIPLVRGGHTTFWVSIASQLEGVSAGIQGFAFALEVTGNVSLDGGTLDGTASAPAPDGLFQRGSFAYVFEVDSFDVSAPPDTPPVQGLVASVVFSVTVPSTMIPRGTADVLAVHISAPEDEDPAGAVVFRDPPRYPAQLSVNAQSYSFGPEDDPLACARSAEIVAADGPAFVRGDADGNGTIELTDGIHIHQYLFLGQPSELACEDAADVNDSGDLDLTDGVLIFMYLFLGGRQPAAPFPACGIDRDDADPLGCRAFDRCL